ncbi:RNA-binding domain-containing protein [Butyrivibrio sp. INlla21]|uniref:RNA-binding domain-containing protein n=1 Tax=Butyrivibrio sp. INlla21 TaxID=1520811 RepID=UPI0008F244A9|nr:RNA-binding domain-containing protein [Butyrivibrio sp. INlla21]SFV01803.1 ATP-dependent DNA helicase RecG [Butyrivibrio sp. INlla21]
MVNIGKETETLEFKKTTGEIKEGMVSIASILNKHGIGTLYFGVKPNGDVVGQEVSESSLRDVSRVVYESIKPQIYPAISEEIFDNSHVIKVEFSGENAPYSVYGRYFLRTADEDREVTPEELKAFFGASRHRGKWERDESEATANQIDKNTIKAFWKKAVEVGRLPEGKYTCPMILNRYGLIKNNHLTNAGEILFGNTHPVTLKMAIFATDEKLTFLDMKIHEDNIYNLLKVAEEYILKNIRWRSEINGFEREEIPEIPIAVIREILANSFAHTIYDGRTQHEICIHPSKITIYSPGDYASEHRPEDYVKRNVESELRNPNIAKILYLTKSIEKFGSGFKRINSLCKDAGVKYSYERTGNGFKFIVFRRKLISDILDVAYDVTYGGGEVLTITEQTVLAVLKQDSTISREEIAERISKTVRTVQRALVTLADKGYIKRVGAKKNSTWEVLK